MIRTRWLLTVIISTVIPESYQSILQSIETCGLFLTSTIRTEGRYRDFLASAIDTIYFHNPNLQALIIQTASNTNQTLLPHIFKSMRHDCFMDIHFNFEKGIFSSMPNYGPDDQIANVLYKINLFLVITVKAPHEYLFESLDWYLQLGREHKVYVLWLLPENFMQPDPIEKATLFFFCAFCEIPLVHLLHNAGVLEVNITTYMKSWKYAMHYLEFGFEGQYGTCEHINLIQAYDYKVKCELILLEYQLMKEITRLNFTVRATHYNYVRWPFSSIFIDAQTLIYNEKYNFSMPLLAHYNKRRILYCINQDFKLTVSGQMWIHNVSPYVWLVVVVIVFASTVVRTLNNVLKNKIKSYFDFFISYLGLVLRFVVRQSGSHNCVFLGLLELLLGLLLAAYENSVTVEVLAPETHKPFESTKDLYLNNYTFVTINVEYPEIVWLKKQYNIGNQKRVIVDPNFLITAGILQKYYWKQKDGARYAVLDNFYTDSLYNRIKINTNQNHGCYKMFPPEKPFRPTPTYYVFSTAIGTDFRIAYTHIKPYGFDALVQRVQAFVDKMEALHSRRLLDQHDEDWQKTIEAEREKSTKYSIINMASLKPVFYLAGLALALSPFCLVLEMLVWTIKSKGTLIDRNALPKDWFWVYKRFNLVRLILFTWAIHLKLYFTLP